MKILFTNDDGYYSPGLACFKKAFPGHEKWIMAPDSDRSGTSHAITLRKPLKLTQYNATDFSCSGNPADCILYALAGAIPVRPDLVISGINLGPNLGTDTVYSGTAAAARQAALSGIPAIAVSTASMDTDQDFSPVITFLEENLQILYSLWAPDFFININFPVMMNGKTTITRPSRRLYKDKVDKFTTQRGDTYLFLSGTIHDVKHEDGSDWKAVEEGYISISPIFLHPINHSEEEIFKKAEFRVKNE
ncbi:MAG: 5'/3'-nucleotidase SurE [Spirochaetales bacterium]|nr:5'/3'-nucleotidase SurE [Spirochaetales bacterium]